MTHRICRGRGKRLTLLLTTALVALGVTGGTASAATQTFSNPSGIAIPDVSPGIPFPSDINVTGFAGNVQKATVTLHNYSHTCPDDTEALLVGPSGANSLLMNHVGGCDTTGFITLTFDQAASASLNDTDVATTGTYKPSSDGSDPDAFDPPAPGKPYALDLNTFNGKAANGIWHLFIQDFVGGDEGIVASGWSLTLNAPVNTETVGKPKLNKKKGTAKVPVTVGDAGNLTLSGKGVKTRNAAFGGPGSGNLTVKAKGKTSRKLNSTGKATVKAKFTFTPNGGASNTVTKKIKLKKN